MNCALINHIERFFFLENIFSPYLPETSSTKVGNTGPKDARGMDSPLHSLPEFKMMEADENFNLMLSSSCLSRGVWKKPVGFIL